MMQNYIRSNIPITIRISCLDGDNKAIVFRALLKYYDDSLKKVIKY